MPIVAKGVGHSVDVLAPRRQLAPLWWWIEPASSQTFPKSPRNWYQNLLTLHNMPLTICLENPTGGYAMGRKGGRGAPTADDTLTPLMEAFCVAYVSLPPGVSAPGPAAVVAAGSLARADGSPGNPASAQASEWLKMPKIQARIKALRDDAAARNPGIITRDELLAGLSQLFRANLTDYQTAGADGVWTDIGKDSPNTLALQSIVSKTTEDGTVYTRVNLADKVKTAERIAKLMGWDAQPDAQNTPAPVTYNIMVQDGGTVQLMQQLGERTKRPSKGELAAPEGQVIDCTDAPDGQGRRE